VNKPTIRNFLSEHLKTAGQLWEEIRPVKTPVDRWLGNYFHQFRKRFGSRDRRFFSETIYGLFRHRSLIEAWAASLDCQNPEVLVLLIAAREGLISEEEFAREIKGRLKTDAAVLFAQLRSGNPPPEIKINSPEEELALRYSFPLWLVRRWYKRFGEERCVSLLMSLCARPPLVIRVNPLKISREKLLERFRSQGHDANPTPVSPYGIRFRERANLFDSEEFRSGFFEVQDEGSQRVCLEIGARPGERIWDVCAGGGGKTLLLAAMMQNKGRIIATDIRAGKLDELRKRGRRAGISIIFPADLNRLDESREMKAGMDRILVDAPCSGSGTLRRNPDAKWKLQEEHLLKFQTDQLAIMETSAPRLKAGGLLYYVTCSLEPEENDEVIRLFLERHPEFENVPVDSRDPFFRLFPDRDETDGFFMAVLRKSPKPL